MDGDGKKISPSRLELDDELCYYVDGDKIKYTTLKKTDAGTAYRSENNLISLAVGKNRTLYALEE